MKGSEFSFCTYILALRKGCFLTFFCWFKQSCGAHFRSKIPSNGAVSVHSDEVKVLPNMLGSTQHVLTKITAIAVLSKVCSECWGSEIEAKVSID